MQVDGDGLFVRQAVLAPAQFVLVVDTGDGRPPVGDQHIRLVAEHAVFADIYLLLQIGGLLRVVDAPEVRFVLCCPILAQGGCRMFLQAAGGHQLVIQFHIAAVYRFVQFLYLGMPLLIFLLVPGHISADDIQAFLEVQLLLPHILILICHWFPPF